MKKLYSYLVFTALSTGALAQGTITQITVDPTNPTTNDDVTIYVDEWFSSGGCPLDNQSHQLSGNTILANAHHCVGLLTVICNATDTFELGQMTAGTYTFELVLTSGAGPIPCTPGIVIDDTMSVSFTVTQAVGIEEIELLTMKFENPVHGVLEFHKPLSTPLQLFDITGKRVMNLEVGTIRADFTNLNSGIYFLRSEDAVRKLVVK